MRSGRAFGARIVRAAPVDSMRLGCDHERCHTCQSSHDFACSASSCLRQNHTICGENMRSHAST